jgi:hypothetical protein
LAPAILTLSVTVSIVVFHYKESMAGHGVGVAMCSVPMECVESPGTVLSLPYREEDKMSDGPLPRKAQKTTPVRLTDEAIRWARIASGYTGESVAEYVSRVMVERGREDADRLHAQVTGPSRRSKKGKDRTGESL